MVQYFKGDTTEVKMFTVGDSVMQSTIAALHDMNANAYESAQFVLMLYDAGRMPFSERIKREVFYAFIQETLDRFPFTGTFDSYLFLLKNIFGSQAEISFDVPDPGKLSVTINAASNVEFNFIARELVGGLYTESEIITQAGEILTFVGISGIETEYELELLFSEIMPAGIVPDISLTFFVSYDFIGEDGDGIFEVVTQDLEQIIFTDSEE